jgi:hypothetical protein
VTLHLGMHDLDAEVKTTGTIRNVQGAVAGSGLILHGIEFDPLEAAQQISLKAFVFDQQCAAAP